jgi:hypothetical protein
VLDPTFCHERDQLAADWEAIAEHDRPAFPLQRSIAVPRFGTEWTIQNVDPKVGNFQCRMDAFLDRWGLIAMTTWDLPFPQGPLIPALINLQSPAMPKQGLHFVLPAYFPLPQSSDLLQEFRRQQSLTCQSAGLDRTIAGLPHFEAYANMFEVWHIERTFRGRYGHVRKGGGLVTVLEAAIAKAIGRQVSYVQKLRKAISAIQRGRRSSIKWLQPPTAGM